MNVAGGVSLDHDVPVSVDTSMAGAGLELCEPTATQKAVVEHETDEM